MATIFFLISSQHFIPAGGIGSFFRGFARMSREERWQLVVVMDVAPRASGKTMMRSVDWVEYVWPANPASYCDHSARGRFAKETVNPAKVENFKLGLNEAIAKHGRPDLVLINTPEAIYAPIARADGRLNVVFYTHHENLFYGAVPSSSKFDPTSNAFLKDIMDARIPGIDARRFTVATQSTYNVDRLKALGMTFEVVVAPMPIPDIDLLTPTDATRDGVLFIGRHEGRKEPKKFAEALANAGLKAKVLTNKRGAAKFAETLRASGVVDFEIKSDIIGAEKCDFIRSAKVAFHRKPPLRAALA